MVTEMKEAMKQLEEELGVLVDTSSLDTLAPSVAGFPKWACCCQSGAEGNCRKDVKLAKNKFTWWMAHHEAPLAACA